MSRALTILLLLLAAVAGAIAAPDASAATNLTRAYRGDDGSALYTRHAGTRLYGFLEHPGTKVALVFRGSVNTTTKRVSGNWWDVAKGSRALDGALDLQWSQDGARIVRKGGRDFGPDVFQAIDRSAIPWAGPLAAGFQATTLGDLDGAFDGDDGSRFYVRESGPSVVGVAEAAAQPGVRPGWVSVLVGSRQGSTGFRGDWVDVPKGGELRSGSWGGALISGRGRELALSQTGVDRTKGLTARYALDWDRFETEVRRIFDGRVTGYGYAIANDGVVVRFGGGGVRLRTSTGTQPFTGRTQSETASTTKLVTAAAVVQALHERGLSIDTRVRGFLPSCWKKGTGIDRLTFRHLLRHTAALHYAGSSVCSSDPYRCLKDAIEKGRTGQTGYHNINYTIFRVILPFVTDGDRMRERFDHYDCKNTNDRLNITFSQSFRDRVRRMLHAVDVEADFGPSTSEVARLYNFSDPKVPGAELTQGYLKAGSGGLKISAFEYAQFLAALTRGRIVPSHVARSMLSERLGFDDLDGSFKGSGGLGPIFTKNGGHGDSQGRGSESQAIILPGGVQAYVIVNSGSNRYPAGFPGKAQALRAAWEASIR